MDVNFPSVEKTVSAPSWTSGRWVLCVRHRATLYITDLGGLKVRMTMCGGVSPNFKWRPLHSALVSRRWRAQGGRFPSYNH